MTTNKSLKNEKREPGKLILVRINRQRHADPHFESTVFLVELLLLKIAKLLSFIIIIFTE